MRLLRERYSMFRQVYWWVVVAGVVVGTCAGCQSSSMPTAPTVTPPGAAPQATYTISGVVYADADEFVPIDGVRIEAGNLQVYVGGLPLLATTGPDGSYSASGIAGPISLRLIKFGYVISEQRISVSADTRVDFRLVPKPTFVLAGVVFEVTSGGPVPVEGASVYCDSCGDGGHSWTATDSQGRYAFPAVYNGTTPIIIGKAGYSVVAPSRTLQDGSGMKDVLVNGDTRFDIELVRR
jgi:hypothetical protein